MNNQTIVCCVVALLLGMLLANMLTNVCGCKLTEGQNPLNNNANSDLNINNNANPDLNINNNANSDLNNNNNANSDLNNNNNANSGLNNNNNDDPGLGFAALLDGSAECAQKYETCKEFLPVENIMQAMEFGGCCKAEELADEMLNR